MPATHCASLRALASPFHIKIKTDRSKQGDYITSPCRTSEVMEGLMVVLGIAATQRGCILLADLNLPVDGMERAGMGATIGAGAGA